MIISIVIDGKPHGHYEVKDLSEAQAKRLPAQMERDLMHFAVGLGKGFKRVEENGASE